MIPSTRWPWFARWFAHRVAARVRSEFSAVMVHGLEPVRELARSHPTLWVANHTAWWDPMVAILLGTHVLELETFAMMATENLVRLRFFGLVGGFGVDRSHRRDGALATRHAAALLDRPRRAVWIFAQGDTHPPAEPVRFHGGAASIHRHAPSSIVVPIGLRYVFGDDPRPQMWLAIGTPIRELPPGAAGTAILEREVMRCLALVDDRTGAFSPLWPVHARGDGLAARLLSRLASAVVWSFGRRFEAALGIDAQRVLGPADGATTTRAREREKQ